MMRLAGLAKTLLLLGAAGCAVPAQAQAPVPVPAQYPNRSIRMIVPFAPGGSADLVARVLAKTIGEQMGQNMVIDNRGGANGYIGADMAAKASPDGYTVLYNTSIMIFSRHIESKLNHDLFRDFEPIALTATVPQILIVPPAFPAKNLKEFIEHVRANPGKLNYASIGSTNIASLTTLLFLNIHKLSAQLVPYNASGTAYLDLVGGRMDFYFGTVAAAAPFVKDNRLRGIAVTSLQRTKVLPDVPTLDESGMPKFEATAWQGMLTSAKTPAAIVNRINAEIIKALKNPELQRQFEAQGTLPLGSTPKEYGEYLRREDERWGKIISDAHLKPGS